MGLGAGLKSSGLNNVICALNLAKTVTTCSWLVYSTPYFHKVEHVSTFLHSLNFLQLIIYYNENNLVLCCISFTHLRWCQCGASFSSFFIGNALNSALDQFSASCWWKRGMIDWEKISLEISVACRLNLFKLTEVVEGSTVLFPSINIFWVNTDAIDIVNS